MKYMPYIVLSVAMTALVLLPAGCETEPVGTQPGISPKSVSVKPGDSVAFKASGGYDYTWSLENESWGILSSREGADVTYRAVYDPGSNTTAQQILKLTSSVSGSTGTNSGGYSTTSEAYITHESSPSSSGSSAIKVTPSEVVMNSGEKQTFKASGGKNYTWSLTQEAWGTLSTRNGSETTYTSYKTSGSSVEVQTLTVTDGSLTATALIKTPAGSVALTIDPSERTVVTNQTITLTASGGTTYSWSLSNESYGTLSSRNGATVNYTSLLGAGTNQVLVQYVTVSSEGKSAQAVIKHQ